MKDEGNETVTNCNGLKLKATIKRTTWIIGCTRENKLNYEYINQNQIEEKV